MPALNQHPAMSNLPNRRVPSTEQSSIATDNQNEVIKEDTNATRQRDSDLVAGQWCEELGEFLPDSAQPSRHNRAHADAWTKQALLKMKQDGYDIGMQ